MGLGRALLLDVCHFRRTVAEASTDKATGGALNIALDAWWFTHSAVASVLRRTVRDRRTFMTCMCTFQLEVRTLHQ